MKAQAASFPQIFSRRSRLTALPVAALSVALTGLASTLSAATCSYGENFNFADATSGGTSKIGTMTNLDIDREPATVTVTRTGGGSLPSQTRGGYEAGAGIPYDEFSPAITGSSVSPIAYGCPLYITALNGPANTPASDNVAPLTFTFSKAMRNLVMHFKGGDNRIFTLTDENDQPLEFTIHYVSTYQTTAGAIPQSGNGTYSVFFKQLTSNSIAIGESSAGTIAFKKPVSVVKLSQVYIGNTRPDLTPATLNSVAADTPVSFNFGQYCDQPGVVGYCNRVNFALWETPTYSASVNPDAYAGRIVDDTGKVISVNFSGGLQQAALITWAGTENAGNPPSGIEEGNAPEPYRPTTKLMAASDTVAAGNPITLTWTFGEEVKNPGLLIRGVSSAIPGSTWQNIKFYKADGTTPLPFLLRNPSSPRRNRQVDANTLFVQEASGSMIQFTESTTAIVAKIIRTAGTGAFTSSGNYNVFLGCDGALTASGSSINTDSDGDGVPDLTDKCANTPAGAVVGSDGCPLPTDLSIVKTASVSKITPGVPFTYTVTVTNTGAQATNVKASDLVPAGLTINSTSASDGGVVTQNGQAVQAVWSIVPNGGTRILTINVTKP